MYKKIITGLLAVVAHCGWVAAQEPVDRPPLCVRVSTGYQQENLHWSIAGNSAGQDPNIYSELKWRHVSGPLLRVAADWNPRANWNHGGRWNVFADGSRVFTRSGKVSDTDYGGDNRTNAVYQQSFDSQQGYSYAVAAGVGYRVLDGSLFRLTPYIGYGVSGQSFSILDPGGIYSFLNSHYITQWKGPILKVDVEGRLAGRWEWEAEVVYHQVNYSAKADWNLISSFSHPVSFRHAADGYGVDAEAAVRYRAGRRVVLRVGGGYFNWQTGKGTDALYLSAGGTDKTQMNGVGRDGWKGEAGVMVAL
jgi:hypothetical protein